MQLNFPSGTVSPSPLPPPAPLTLTPGVPPLPLWSPKGGAKDPWGSQGVDTSLWGRQCCHWSQLVLTGPTTARHHDDTGGDGRCLAPKTLLCDFWLNRYIGGKVVFSQQWVCQRHLWGHLALVTGGCRKPGGREGGRSESIGEGRIARMDKQMERQRD